MQISNLLISTANDVPQYLTKEFAKTSNSRRVATLLAPKGWHPSSMLDLVFKAAHSGESALWPRAKTTCGELCVDQQWASWRKSERIAAGICLAYLVKADAVPLVMHRTKSGSGTKRYLRRHQ